MGIEDFHRIYEAGNYARVEDSIKDLDDSLYGVDSSEIGYGIARNNAMNGGIRDVERTKDVVQDVKKELSEIESGLSEYERAFSRIYGASNQQAPTPSYSSGYRVGHTPTRGEALSNYTKKIVGGRMH